MSWEEDQLRRQVEERRQAAAQGVTPTQPPESADPEGTYSQMLKEIRSWGLWLVGSGVLHLVISGFLDPTWGLLLIAVGASSFFFREASVFVVYGISMVWAAVNNMLAGDLAWIGAALLQLYWAAKIFLQYGRFRRAQEKLVARSEEGSFALDATHGRAARVFPWLSLFLGALVLTGYVIILVMLFVLSGFVDEAELASWFDFLFGVTQSMGILALAVGLASLLSRYRYKGAAVLGIVGGVLSIVVLVALLLM